MPSLGAFHPLVVHFVVALLIVGVLFRLLSLTGRVRFAGPAATTLIVAGAIAAFVAVQSGHDAHEPVERIPGVRPAVQEHEEWGERTRNVFAVVAVLELAAAGLGWKKNRYAKVAVVVSALAGAGGLFVLYQTADLGGDLVYSYAGGPGLRTGEAADVDHLFAAGVFEQALAERKAGHHADAAELIDLAVRRFPADLDWQLAAADSSIEDRQDPQAALARLDALDLSKADERMRLRVGLMRSTAHQSAGDLDAARADLEGLKKQFPTNPFVGRLVDRRLEQLGSKP
jgi:uncharacterized membrane protein